MSLEVRLRRVTFRPAPGSLPHAYPTRADGQLQLTDGAVTHMVRVEDVLGLLMDLVSTAPHRTGAQTLTTRPAGPDVEVTLTNSATRTTFIVPHEEWYLAVLAMITEVADVAGRAGAHHLLTPLMAVLAEAGPRT